MILRIYDPSECDERGVPLDWERCRTCLNGLPPHPDDPNQGDCPTCDGHGSLKAAALAAKAFPPMTTTGPPYDPAKHGHVPIRFPDGYELTIRCEDCGHPMSEGTWDGRYPFPEGQSLPAHFLRNVAHHGFAFDSYVHFSPCDEGCRHGDEATRTRWIDPDYFAPDDRYVIEASWRPVDVRTLGWAHDLRPERLAVLCLRCYTEKKT